MPACAVAAALLLAGCAAPSPYAARVDALQRFYEQNPGSRGVLKVSAIRAAATDSAEAVIQQPEGLTFIKFVYGAKTEYGVWEVDASGRFVNPIINRPHYNLAAAFARLRSDRDVGLKSPDISMVERRIHVPARLQRPQLQDPREHCRG